MHGNVDIRRTEKSKFGQRFLMLTSVLSSSSLSSIDRYAYFVLHIPHTPTLPPLSPRARNAEIKSNDSDDEAEQNKTLAEKKIWNKFKMNECALLRYHFLLIQRIANS